jgi:hypothetical protein
MRAAPRRAPWGLPLRRERHRGAWGSAHPGGRRCRTPEPPGEGHGEAPSREGAGAPGGSFFCGAACPSGEILFAPASKGDLSPEQAEGAQEVAARSQGGIGHSREKEVVSLAPAAPWKKSVEIGEESRGDHERRGKNFLLGCFVVKAHVPRDDGQASARAASAMP